MKSKRKILVNDLNFNPIVDELRRHVYFYYAGKKYGYDHSKGLRWDEDIKTVLKMYMEDIYRHLESQE